MLRTKNTIIGKISSRGNYCNTTHGLKIQENTDGPMGKISTSIDQILHSKLNLETSNSAGSGKSTITQPYEVTTTRGNQENEVKSSEVIQKPYKVSAVTDINSASIIYPPICASTCSYAGIPINSLPSTGKNPQSVHTTSANLECPTIPIVTSANYEINSAKIRNFFHAPVFRNFRTRKKLFRVPNYIQYNTEPKPGPSFDVGKEKWPTEQFSNRNFIFF